MRVGVVAVVVSSVLWLTSCSSTKILQADDLRSQVKQGAAFTSETRLFLDRISEDRVTRNFASGHLEYLLHEVDDAVQQAHHSVPQSTVASQYGQYRSQMERLQQLLANLPNKLSDKSALAEADSELQHIQVALQRTLQSL